MIAVVAFLFTHLIATTGVLYEDNYLNNLGLTDKDRKRKAKLEYKKRMYERVEEMVRREKMLKSGKIYRVWTFYNNKTKKKYHLIQNLKKTKFGRRSKKW